MGAKGRVRAGRTGPHTAGAATPPKRSKVQATLPPELAWRLRMAAAYEGVTPCVLIARWISGPLARYDYPEMPAAAG